MLLPEQGRQAEPAVRVVPVIRTHPQRVKVLREGQGILRDARQTESGGIISAVYIRHNPNSVGGQEVEVGQPGDFCIRIQSAVDLHREPAAVQVRTAKWRKAGLEGCCLLEVSRSAGLPAGPQPACLPRK